MSQLMFYENVTPLNRDQHRALRLNKSNGDYGFAAGANLAPVAAVEFAPASADYPILFSGTETDPAPVALFGLSQGGNLFVERDGQWAPGCYVPAFVRRYPFVLARTGQSDGYTVCIDDRYKGFGETEGEALFTDDGTDSPLLRDSIIFLQGFLTEMERTTAFAKRLCELGLLVTRDMQLTDAKGKTTTLRGFRVVDESRLAGLSDEVVIEFHRAGYWPWIYAHLFSLGNVARLQARATQTS